MNDFDNFHDSVSAGEPFACRISGLRVGIKVATGTIVMNASMIESDTLRYVDADHVDTPAGRLGDAVVVGPTGAKIGDLDGIVVDPGQRRAPYLVVAVRKRLRTRKYLLPLAPSRIDSDHVVHVELDTDELDQLPEISGARIPSLSDEDVVDAVFGSRPS